MILDGFIVNSLSPNAASYVNPGRATEITFPSQDTIGGWVPLLALPKKGQKCAVRRLAHTAPSSRRPPSASLKILSPIARSASTFSSRQKGIQPLPGDDCARSSPCSGTVQLRLKLITSGFELDQPESSGAQPNAQLRRSSAARLGFGCASPGIISLYLTSINRLLTITYNRDL